MTDETLKHELEALGLRLVKRAMGEPDDGPEMPENAVEVFKIVGAWEVGSRKVKKPTEDDSAGATFGAIKERIQLAHKGGNA
ncbi:MAG TPA: hypothetical protein VHT52_06375 [Stellaceae bacterium]|jgi:hypothetical protein|nr:hypothetical protein [Stellaceae bacterium]